MKKINEPIFNLDAEEQAVHDALVAGGYESRPITDEQRAYFREAALNTLNKRKTLTLRITGRDLMKVKAAAAREGVPYQTYITSLIHKYVG